MESFSPIWRAQRNLATAGLPALFAIVLLCASARWVGADVVPDAVRARVASEESVRVIVTLHAPPSPAWVLHDRKARASYRRLIGQARDDVIARIGPQRMRGLRTFEDLPLLAFDADAESLEALERSTWVASVQEDRRMAPLLDTSVAFIGAKSTLAAGFDGSGWTIAVLDTGVDGTHPAFPGKIVAEACFSAGGDCPNGQTAQIGSGAAVPCTYAAACSHGTHVTGIAASDDRDRKGVAPGADLIAIQVFSRDTGSECDVAGEDPCALAFTSDMIAGLEYVASLADSFDIAAVNLSLGSQLVASERVCDGSNQVTKSAIDTLRNLGIATIAAAGNDGSTDSLTTPACISSALSVGATDESDEIWPGSNSDASLDFLAPGVLIRSAVPETPTGQIWQVRTGTSMAAPHVAGAWAVARQAAPFASVDELAAAFRSQGVPITDDRNGVTAYRIQVDDALRLLAPAPCYDGFDNDGDGATDFPDDPQCEDGWSDEVSDCGDSIDNDEDGLVDHPADPGCESPFDDSERSDALECDDGVDNDADGSTDHPSDPQCDSPTDPSEAAACSDGLDNDGDGATDHPADPGCASSDDDSEISESLICDDGLDNDGDGATDSPADPGCASSSDDSETSEALVCDDGLDNDGDGASDFPADPGCDAATDDDEHSSELACDDGLDGDGDGAADFPEDPGCASPADAAETSEALVCDDGLDNDGDGASDFPADPGCSASGDDTETSEALVCDDGLDNDGDGASDFPADPGCASSEDDDERSAELVCDDGLDNDGNGSVDFPEDPGCTASTDPGEVTLEENDILVANSGGASILRINDSGGQAVVSAGGLLVEPVALALGPGGQLWVVDAGGPQGEPAVLRVDRWTGEQVLVSAGGDLVAPGGIVVEALDSLLVVDSDAFGGTGGVLRIATASGAQSPVSVGGDFVNPSGITIAANGMLLVTDRDAFGSGGVIEVNPQSGAQRTLSSSGDFAEPSGIAIYSASGGLVVDSQADSGAVIDVDLESGSQNVIASGGDFVSPDGIVVAGDGEILIADSAAAGSGAIFALAAAGGVPIEIASGNELATPRGLAIVRTPEPTAALLQLGALACVIALARARTARRRPATLRCPATVRCSATGSEFE